MKRGGMSKHTVRETLLGLALALLAVASLSAGASELHHHVERHYPYYPPAPAAQLPEQADVKSAGCLSCHLETDAYSMHENPGVVLGCTDCHGGDAGVFVAEGAEEGSALYTEALEAAHVLPEYPDDWHFPHSKNPQQSYTLLNRESP